MSSPRSRRHRPGPRPRKVSRRVPRFPGRSAPATHVSGPLRRTKTSRFVVLGDPSATSDIVPMVRRGASPLAQAPALLPACSSLAFGGPHGHPALPYGSRLGNHRLKPVPPARDRNSSRVSLRSRNAPSMALVMAPECCFSTPRIIMQKCRASQITPTPSGSMHFLDGLRHLAASAAPESAGGARRRPRCAESCSARSPSVAGR